MSKAALDSDLYGDIYGDEFNDFLDPAEEGGLTEIASTDPHGTEDPAEDTVSDSGADSTTTQNHDAPQPGGPSPDQSPGLSYSAQVAQQFSAYKQTPSQERQQRFNNALPRSNDKGRPATSPESIFGKKPSEMHDAGKIFVGGLSWDTTDEGLRDYFEQFGKVDACTIMRDPAGTSRGFAFMTFEDPNCLETVLNREHVLDGKTIDPKRAIPREEHLRNTRYFVGGLAHNTTPESMRAFFSSYGKVVDATVMLDRETGRSKGFGFVTFEDVGNSLDHIVGKVGLMLDDKEIEIKVAQARSQRDQTRTLVNKIASNREPTPDRAVTQPNRNFNPAPSAQLNPMAAMMFNRPMSQFPMMANVMPLMGMNPMMGMGMGLMGMNQMPAMGGGGMPAMNMMGGMNGLAASHPMNNMGAMRMGMGSMTMPGMMGMGSMNAMSGMAGNMGRGFAKPGMHQGTGPTRTTGANRKQNGFHPYSR